MNAKDIIALAVATVRHPRTGEVMVGRQAKKRAENILSLLRDAGFAVVPIDPTQAMLNCGGTSEQAHDKALSLWSAMVDEAEKSR